MSKACHNMPQHDSAQDECKHNADKMPISDCGHMQRPHAHLVLRVWRDGGEARHGTQGLRAHLDTLSRPYTLTATHTPHRPYTLGRTHTPNRPYSLNPTQTVHPALHPQQTVCLGLTPVIQTLHPTTKRRKPTAIHTAPYLVCGPDLVECNIKLNRKPSTLYPTSCTRYNTPYLNPKPYTQHPAPYLVSGPKLVESNLSRTLNPTPDILHQTHCTLPGVWPRSCGMRQSSCGPGACLRHPRPT